MKITIYLIMIGRLILNKIIFYNMNVFNCELYKNNIFDKITILNF